jgi:hypothetical protein
MRNLFVTLTIISLMACNSEPTWTARCYSRFLEEENKLQTKIEIRTVGQEKVAALQMDEVRFNEGAMEHRDNNVIGHYYQADGFSGYPTSGFEFQIQQAKEKAIIQFDVPELKGYALKEGNVSKSKGFTITWQGKPLSKDEMLTVTLSDIDGTTAQAVVNGATAAAEARIPSAMYSGLKPGKGSFFLVKTSLPKTKTKNINAEAEVGYYTKNVDVEIIE